MSAHPPAIRLAQDSFCIAGNAVCSLKLCPTITATLKGVGMEPEKRKFALLIIDDRNYLADVITGTLYDDMGCHHNDPNLRVTGISKAAWSKAVEVA
jgi:hypothetical protein